MKDWSNYQNKTYKNNANKLLIEFCKKYKVKTAVDLGCGSGNESVYLLNKGINVTCIDRQLNKSYILDRLIENECGNVKFIESSFEEVNIPTCELLIAFFSIPFCSPDKFDILWNKIYESIEINGYFVGQLFGDRDDWNNIDSINTFTIEQAKKYLENIILLNLMKLNIKEKKIIKNGIFII